MMRLLALTLLAVIVVACGTTARSANPADADTPEPADGSSPNQTICESATILLESLRDQALGQAVAPDVPIDPEAVTRKAGIVALAGEDVQERMADATSAEHAELIVAIRDAGAAYAVFGLAVKDWIDAGAEVGDFDRRELMYGAGIDASDALGDVRSRVELADAAGTLDCDLR